jgi:CubicO group peptidase (beta-lactamase class C family)
MKQDITVVGNGHDFSPVQAAMQRYVDSDLLPGVSYAVLRGRELIDLNCVGWADKEQAIPLRNDHIFRAFSNTKLVTTCAAMLLFEEGRFALDDPIEKWLPQLGNRYVLKPGATSLDDTETARGSITVRHLLSHSSGLSYGLLDPGTTIFKAYSDRKILSPATTLAEMVDALAPLPLVFHPGTGWEYSIATDVVSRLVEVLGGQGFDAFIQERIFGPLGMVDTGFVVPEDQRDRLTAYYMGADLDDPTKPGLTRIDHQSPWPGAYLRPAPRLSGGGGLVTTLPDMVALLRSLLPGGATLLKHQTLALMMSNQLAPDARVQFPGKGRIEGKVFGLGGALTLAPSAAEPPGAVGEFQWGGMAGTHWWISPRQNLAGLLMTQRLKAFWDPFSFEFRRRVYEAASAETTAASAG